MHSPSLKSSTCPIRSYKNSKTELTRTLLAAWKIPSIHDSRIILNIKIPNRKCEASFKVKTTLLIDNLNIKIIMDLIHVCFNYNLSDLNVKKIYDINMDKCFSIYTVI